MNMEIKSTDFYTNKTKKYLLPLLKYYDSELIAHLNAIFKLGVGIDDIAVSRNKQLFENNIYILINVNVALPQFIKTLDWVKQQPYYKYDYPFDDITEGHQHMIVLEIPKEFSPTYNNFINSKFSKMYSRENIDYYFPKVDDRVKVLLKDEEATEKFVEMINTSYDTHYTAEEWIEEKYEIELPIKNDEEIFNYKLKTTKNV